ncbi:hypothetical protein AMATHDRAFT_64003 [Amanita thiersii Skay4041]|uniref:EF-hand domain-containing protein n=1 Tax=Amanita thiersii Skay4041 TaxID=703135 RepID=A0A2A9NN13_9AGAR|nr:hypothetical protein AMATHDRAFT_64003 [Amanita thiersii Skay4041]
MFVTPGASKAKRRAQSRMEMTEEQQAEAHEAFDLFDADKDGQIDFHEFKVALRALGFDLKKAEILKLLKDHDKPPHSRLSFDDFAGIVVEQMAQRDPDDEIRRAFRLFADPQSGKINVRDLKRVAKEIGETLEEDELQAMIDEFDLDGDHAINEQEFFAIMKSD